MITEPKKYPRLTVGFAQDAYRKLFKKDAERRF